MLNSLSLTPPPPWKIANITQHITGARDHIQMCDSLENSRQEAEDKRLGLHNALIMWSYSLGFLTWRHGGGGGQSSCSGVWVLACWHQHSLLGQLARGEPSLMLSVTPALTLMLRYHPPASLTVSVKCVVLSAYWSCLLYQSLTRRAAEDRDLVRHRLAWFIHTAVLTSHRPGG